MGHAPNHIRYPRRQHGASRLRYRFSQAHRLETGRRVAARRQQKRADSGAAHQQLGLALHADDGLCLQAEYLLDGQGADLQAPVSWPDDVAGGIPVERETSNNLVAASAEAIKAADGPLQLVVSPEGTRSKVRHWKSGFYYIATGASVPIVLAYLAYANKRGGIGPVFQPTGNLEADMQDIQAFYRPFKGKNPSQSGPD
jgi:hypothetical protein